MYSRIKSVIIIVPVNAQMTKYKIAVVRLPPTHITTIVTTIKAIIVKTVFLFTLYLKTGEQIPINNSNTKASGAVIFVKKLGSRTILLPVKKTLSSGNIVQTNITNARKIINILARIIALCFGRKSVSQNFSRLHFRHKSIAAQSQI